MNATPPRLPEPVERAELARLLPDPGAPDLPADRILARRMHLMNEISRDTTAAAARPRRRLPLTLAPLAAGALVIAGVAAVSVTDHAATGPVTGAHADAGSSTGAARYTDAPGLLRLVAAATATQPTPRADQYVYIKSINTAGPVGHKDQMKPGSRHEREVWLPVDNTRDGLIREDGQDTTLGGVRPYDAGAKDVYGSVAPALSLKDIPADPDAALRKIYSVTNPNKHDRDQQAFDWIGNLIFEAVVPPQTGATLYQAAAKIPGVTLLSRATDFAGRTGVAVARVSDGVRTEWIFNPDTFEYLGSRSTVVQDGPNGKAGAVVAQSAVLERAVVDAPGKLPH
ncbi:CU044_5270 family protein [Planosporangium sp. 12N6]|uniref:CU044_5270 family protein n=1 Tax=Planosporangium spinosum TaxID=3402278 RepID=UPI003CF18BF5